MASRQPKYLLPRKAKPRGHRQSFFDLDSKIQSNYTSTCKVQCPMTDYQAWKAPKSQEFTTECCMKFRVSSSDQSSVINNGISF